MKQTILKLAVAGGFFTLLAGLVPALADSMDADKGHDMSMMKPAGTIGTIPVNAIINKIDVEKHSINVTHDPIPALKWPTMTMDIAVTKRVDLSKVKEGASVILSLKQGRDKQYRITEIKPQKN
jgi:Cu(I)/Ag(I) efflux system periplasmic protein CusF